MFRTRLNQNSRRPSLGALIMLALAINGVFTLVGFIRPARAYNQELEKLNRFVQTSNASNDEVAIFRQGRDLIADESWEDAAEKFGEYVEKYPKGKEVDAALYWLSYALVKEQKFDAANRTISRLLAQFPNSRWRRDAEALRLQTPTRQPAKNIDSLEGDEEKIIVLQSLCMGNPEQCAVQAAAILRNSNASRHLKEAAITLVGQHRPSQSKEILVDVARNNSDAHLRKTAIFWLGQSGDENILDLLKELSASPDDEISKTAIFAISQHRSPRADVLLAEMARNGASRRLREEAIFWVSQRGNPANDQLLAQIFDSEKDTEIRKKVIFALTQRHSEAARAKLFEIARSATDKDVRQDAIFWVGQRGGDQAADELSSLFDAERDPEIRKKIIFSLSQMNNQKARTKLMDVVRSSDDAELRGETIFWLAQTGGNNTVDFLGQLYDSEKTMEVKKKIIFSLTQAREKKAALHKLMAIARSDPSPELRKEAIFWIGQSRDPEAIKFLEDILK
ncbi:MAG TPA: HEAT repeat domain-containing protein [Blastocatellia bacterium]|nr:HEAT repeat domain-containing protein [Blastocatellia bacterium]